MSGFPELPGVPIAIPVAFVAIFGALVGSFLNVVIYRVPRHESIVKPRSRCPGCSAGISWYDNIPIVSWLLLRGRCRACKTAISVRYPIVEAITSLLFVAIFWRFGFAVHTPVYLAFAAVMVALTFIDIDHRIIPNVISLPGIIVGLAISVVLAQLPGALNLSWSEAKLPVSWTASLFGILLGGGILWTVAMIYERIRGEEGMGMGDVKMLGMIGAFLGAGSLLFVVFVSAFVGSIVGVSLMVFAGGTRKTAVPFGPYLAAASLLYLFVGPEIVAMYLHHALPPS